MEFASIDRIYFGNKEKDLNLCDLKSHFYKIKDGIMPDLSKITTNNFSLILESSSPHTIRDLHLNFYVNPEDRLRIRYTYANMTGVENVPFDIPDSVFNAHVPPTPWFGSIANYINLRDGIDAPLIIEVKGVY
jgi:hypothetical protein